MLVFFNTFANKKASRPNAACPVDFLRKSGWIARQSRKNVVMWQVTLQVHNYFDVARLNLLLDYVEVFPFRLESRNYVPNVKYMLLIIFKLLYY